MRSTGHVLFDTRKEWGKKEMERKTGAAHKEKHLKICLKKNKTGGIS